MHLPLGMGFIAEDVVLSAFGHYSSVHRQAPARNALHCQIGMASGRSLGGDWKRRRGRPRARWTDQLRNDIGCHCQPLAVLRGHDGATQWTVDEDDVERVFTVRHCTG